MKKIFNEKLNAGQAAIEYLLIFGTVTTVALVGFYTFFPTSRTRTEEYMNEATRGIMGETAMYSGDDLAPGAARSAMAADAYP